MMKTLFQSITYARQKQTHPTARAWFFHPHVDGRRADAPAEGRQARLPLCFGSADGSRRPPPSRTRRDGMLVGRAVLTP